MEMKLDKNDREGTAAKEPTLPVLDFYSYLLSVSNLWAIFPGAMAYGLIKHAYRNRDAGRR
jgi:hypothetical protein